MSLAVWTARRIGVGVVLLFAASLLVFFATRALPGDAAQAILGQRATPARLRELRQELGLDKPMLTQYLSWLGGVLHGDFGRSLTTREAVGPILSERLGNSAILFFIAAGISIPLSIAVGCLIGAKRDSLVDDGVVGISMILNSLPEFVVGILLVAAFSTTLLTVLPGTVVLAEGSGPLTDPQALVLPVATLVLKIMPYLSRLVRGSVIDALESEYVAMARLRGVTERRVVLRHALPNAVIPTIQGSAYVLTYLMGGVVVVEFLFNYPGLGRTLTDAVAQRDMPVIQAVVLVLAAGVVVFNILADLLSVLVSPRLRTRGSAR